MSDRQRERRRARKEQMLSVRMYTSVDVSSQDSCSLLEQSDSDEACVGAGGGGGGETSMPASKRAKMAVAAAVAASASAAALNAGSRHKRSRSTTRGGRGKHGGHSHDDGDDDDDDDDDDDGDVETVVLSGDETEIEDDTSSESDGRVSPRVACDNGAGTDAVGQERRLFGTCVDGVPVSILKRRGHCRTLGRKHERERDQADGRGRGRDGECGGECGAGHRGGVTFNLALNTSHTFGDMKENVVVAKARQADDGTGHHCDGDADGDVGDDHDGHDGDEEHEELRVTGASGRDSDAGGWKQTTRSHNSTTSTRRVNRGSSGSAARGGGAAAATASTSGVTPGNSIDLTPPRQSKASRVLRGTPRAQRMLAAGTAHHRQQASPQNIDQQTGRR
ncbi:hypothetical protein PTSG_00735 [Salpingoeca rosetta]|uniref:Uncharacterized protein n=1 Tax=Salpingoeca rosetta (strain ATCC 50818 / BSB-021) TaxID=946362 RepID=F2TXB6_SALR5|nr:uncharacterized protein PTSG_00735 [Salpingoeca rosetta]EGD76025.1 hypothetical protein PTSG_00735 [Salpingoeca rosetta]|eukprot:XP_004998200.1 hypothetical protein PTSG_00735 [Salpingoeca rosetta]